MKRQFDAIYIILGALLVLLALAVACKQTKFNEQIEVLQAENAALRSTLEAVPTPYPQPLTRKVIGMFQDYVQFIESTWTYEAVEVHWNTGEVPFKVIKNNNWTCFKMVAMTAEPVPGKEEVVWLVSHGDENELCFLNLTTSEWKGPVTP